MSEVAPADDAIGVALCVARAIEAVGGAYFVGGSVASSLQGDPRSTNDVDIVVSLPLGRIRAFVDALGGTFEVDVDMLRETLLAGGCCNIFYLPVLTKVDLFALGSSPYDEVEFARRKAVQVRRTYGDDAGLSGFFDSQLYDRASTHMFKISIYDDLIANHSSPPRGTGTTARSYCSRARGSRLVPPGTVTASTRCSPDATRAAASARSCSVVTLRVHRVSAQRVLGAPQHLAAFVP